MSRHSPIGKRMPENIIIPSQMLLKKQRPHIESLKDTFKGKFLLFQPVGEKKMSVQILHAGMQSSNIDLFMHTQLCL